MRQRRATTSSSLCGFLVAGLLVAPAGAAEATALRSPDVSNQKMWQEALTALGNGKFDDSLRLMQEVAEKSQGDRRVQNVSHWVADFGKLQAERKERIRADYEKYVTWVKEETAKGAWKQAMWDAAMAFNNAEDPEAFRREPWLTEAVEGAVKAAAEYEKDRKWVKAATIYVRLTEIFPTNKEYRDALDRCQAHLRLEYTYTADSDWRATVADIQPEMAREAFRKIDSEYLREPEFKQAIVRGLEQVLRVAQEPKIAKELAGLNNKDAVEEFVSRVNVRLKYARQSDKQTVDDLISVFNRVLQINDETRLLPQNVLVYEFVQGALQPLDRFSDMIWPADLQEFNKHTQGRFSGVGIQIRKGPGEPIKVVSPLEDTPAYRAGIQPNDTIVKINGKSALKYTINAAVREITGPPGTYVTLTVKRPGQEKEFDVKLERQEITIFTIKGFERDAEGKWKYMIDPVNKIAYIRMTNFTEGTIDELKEVIRQLRNDEGMRGLIFDLRGNPGGPLKSAVEVSDLFLDGDKKIVSTKDRHGKPWQMSSGDDVHFTDFPMIVIANRISASASEIVTGALQVHGRALIVGERTFGKGSVQQVLRLNNSPAFLKLTTAHYYLPDGRCLHRDEDSTTWGVDPDVEVKLVPKEIVKAADLRLKTDILKGVNQKELTSEELKAVTEYKPSTKPATSTAEEKEDDEAAEEEEELEEPTREDPNDWPEIDPQLEAAMMLMRVRLESNYPWPLNPPKVASVNRNGDS